MIYELRIYYVKKGKLKNINDRFANHTLSIFERHNMKVVDFWQDISEEKIYYIMEYDNMDDRNKKFEEFAKDPEWIKVKADSEVDGNLLDKLESFFMERVPYFKK